MQHFRLVLVCFFGLAAAVAQAAERPDPPQPVKKPGALLPGKMAAVAAPAQPAAGALPKGVFIQLASLSSRDAAAHKWLGLQKSHPRLLDDFRLTVEPADLGSRGWFYRVQAGPLPNRATATDLCWQFKAKQQDCIVVQR